MIKIKKGAEKSCSITLNEYTGRKYLNLNRNYDSNHIGLLKREDGRTIYLRAQKLER